MRRLALFLSITLTIVYVSCVAIVAAANKFDRFSKINMINYWGQNSVSFNGGSEGDLIDYCQNDTVDALVIAFIYQIENGVPILNLAKHCGERYPSTPHLRCPKIGHDIQACQARGKAVLISIGGATGSHSIQDASQGRALAEQVWQLFLGGSHPTRPFGTAILDGVDLDLESGQNAGYTEFVRALRTEYFASPDHNRSGRTFMITAAPQCPYPDQAMKELLASSYLDLVFIQFYNNYCGVQSFNSPNFNFATWNNWAATVSANKNVRVLLGVPGGPGAAGSGIIEGSQLNTILTDVAKYSHFGGVMMWDAGIAHKSGLATSAKAHLLRSSSHDRIATTTTTTTTMETTMKSAPHTVLSTATTTTTTSSKAAAATATVTVTVTAFESHCTATAFLDRPSPSQASISVITSSRHTHGVGPTSTTTTAWPMETDYMGRPIKKGSRKWLLKKPRA